MFFESWSELGRVIAVGGIAYAALILLLLVSGKRTLSKMNAFDFVITVAIGSTLATILLSKDVTLAAGVTALALLIALQFVLTWLSVRSPAFRRLVKAEPQLLLRNGEFLPAAMKRERITAEEIRQAIRREGVGALEEVAAVVLETDGSISVIGNAQAGASALSNVQSRQSRDSR